MTSKKKIISGAVILVIVLIMGAVGLVLAYPREFKQLTQGKNWGKNFAVGSLNSLGDTLIFDSSKNSLKSDEVNKVTLETRFNLSDSYIDKLVSLYEDYTYYIDDEQLDMMKAAANILGKSKLTATVVVDESKAIQTDFALNKDDLDILSLDAVLKGDFLTLTLPDLFKNPIKLNFKDIMEILDGAYGYYSDYGFSESFDSLRNPMAAYDVSVFKDAYRNGVKAMLEVEGLEFKKSDNVEYEVNGGNVKFDAVTVELSSHELYSMCYEFLNAIKNDSKAMDALKKLQEVYPESFSGITLDESIDEALSDIALMRDEDTSKIKLFRLTLLADKSNKLGGVAFGLIDEDNLEVSIIWSLGTGYMLQMQIFDGWSNISCDIYGDLNGTSKSYTGNANLKYNDDYNTYEGKLFDFDYSTNSFGMEIALNDVAQTFGLDVGDAIDIIGKDTVIKLTSASSAKKADSTITIKNNDGLDVTMTAVFEPFSGTITEPEGAVTFNISDGYEALPELFNNINTQGIADLGKTLSDLGLDVQDYIGQALQMLELYGMYY